MYLSSSLRFIAAAAGLACILPAHAQRAPETDWDVSLGAIAVQTPVFQGSSKRHAQVFPLVDAVYKDTFFFKTDPIPGATIRGLGMYLYHQDGLDISGSIAPSFQERKEADDPRVKGLGNVSATARAAIAASYTSDWWQVSAAVTKDLSSSKKQGLAGGIDVSGMVHYSKDLTLSAGPGFTYGNAEYTRTFFGVNAVQHAQSNFAAYDPRGGVADIHFHVGASYNLGDGWFMGANAAVSKLRGDAGNSPIVARKTQTAFGTYLGYHF